MSLSSRLGLALSPGVRYFFMSRKVTLGQTCFVTFAR